MILYLAHITHSQQSFQLRRLQKYDLNSLEISRLRETVVEKLLAKLLQQEKRAKRPLQHPIEGEAGFRAGPAGLDFQLN